LSNMISLGARKKRRNYDVNEYFREAMNTHNNTTGGRQKVAKPKSIPMHDFQFFQQARIKELFQKEFELSVQKREQVQTIKVIRGKETRERRKAMKQEPDLAAETILTANELKTQAEELESALHKYDLTEEESKEKETLISEGMGKWIKSDFRKFLSACERHGRKAQAAICTDVALATGKTEQEVREYFDVFWRRYKELGDWKKIIDKIERGERKIQRRHEIEEAIKSKVSRHKDPYNTLSIEYGSNKGKAFTEEEDRFLLCKMSEIGYGQWHLMQLEIRKAWQFRFDWFLKSRTAAELQRRSDSIIRLVEKENKAKLTKRKRPNKSGSNKKKKYKRTKK